MSGKVVASVAVAAVVIVAAMVGVGYAMYQGSSSSVGVDSDTVLTASVDIYTSSGNGYSLLSAPIKVPTYERGQEVTIEGYYVMVTGNQGQNSSIRLSCPCLPTHRKAASTILLRM